MGEKFKKGMPKPEGSGRKKGVQNKTTTTVKAAVLAVFNKLQENKENPANLENWANENPTEFYKIASKLIPTEVNASSSVIKVVVQDEEDAEEENENNE